MPSPSEQLVSLVLESFVELCYQHQSLSETIEYCEACIKQNKVADRYTWDLQPGPRNKRIGSRITPADPRPAAAPAPAIPGRVVHSTPVVTSAASPSRAQVTAGPACHPLEDSPGAEQTSRSMREGGSQGEAQSREMHSQMPSQTQPQMQGGLRPCVTPAEAFPHVSQPNVVSHDSPGGSMAESESVRGGRMSGESTQFTQSSSSTPSPPDTPSNPYSIPPSSTPAVPVPTAPSAPDLMSDCPAHVKESMRHFKLELQDFVQKAGLHLTGLQARLARDARVRVNRELVGLVVAHHDMLRQELPRSGLLTPYWQGASA